MANESTKFTRIYNEHGEEVVPVKLPKAQSWWAKALKTAGYGAGIALFVILFAWGLSFVIGSDEQEQQTLANTQDIIEVIEQIETDLSKDLIQQAGLSRSIARANLRLSVEIECLIREHENPTINLEQCILQQLRQGGDNSRGDGSPPRQP